MSIREQYAAICANAIEVTSKLAANPKWMQDVSKQMTDDGTKGALHRYFKIPEGETIPTKLLRDTLKKNISERTRKRIQLTLTFRGEKVTALVASSKPRLPAFKDFDTFGSSSDYQKTDRAASYRAMLGHSYVEIDEVKPGRWVVKTWAMNDIPGFEDASHSHGWLGSNAAGDYTFKHGNPVTFTSPLKAYSGLKSAWGK